MVLADQKQTTNMLCMPSHFPLNTCAVTTVMIRRLFGVLGWNSWKNLTGNWCLPCQYPLLTVTYSVPFFFFDYFLNWNCREGQFYFIFLSVSLSLFLLLLCAFFLLGVFGWMGGDSSAASADSLVVVGLDAAQIWFLFCLKSIWKEK